MPADVRKRFFTLAEANVLLPGIRKRLLRMMQLSAHLRGSSDGDKTPTPPGTPWLADPVVAAWEAQSSETSTALATCLYETLSEELRAFEAIGVVIKDLTIGLVDFPSYLDGTTEVVLCWKVDEADVRHYHHPHSGYRSRKPVEGHDFHREPTPSGQLRD
jgi:hypothetical protein